MIGAVDFEQMTRRLGSFPERIRFEHEMYDLGVAETGPGRFRYPTYDSEASYELGQQDVTKYREMLRALAKNNKDPNKLTNMIFWELHRDLKNKKLLDTHRESLKNEWANLYYQVVLPHLGIQKTRPGFTYSDELKRRISAIREQLDNTHAVFLAIRPKTPNPSEFENNPEVASRRGSANKAIHDLLIPLLIEGLNLHKPADVYRALVSLDDGHLVDTYIEIISYNPALLPAERQKRYESMKLLFVKTIKSTIANYLEKRSPSDIQTGVEPKGSRGENVLAKHVPDNAKYNITGRFEFVDRSARSGALGMVLCLNQAGNWVEGVLSTVGDPQKFTDNPKFFYRFYAQIKDWSRPSPMIFIRGNLDAFKVNARLLVLSENSVQVVVNKGPINLKRVSTTPILTERHLASFKDNPLVRQGQWFPLLSAQEENIKSYFRDFRAYQPILNYPKFNNPKAKSNRGLHIKTLLERAIKGDKDSFHTLAAGISQFIEENIHKSDRDIAAFYIRHYLNKTHLEKDGWRMTLASWLYRLLRIHKEYRYRVFQNFIFGATGGDKVTPVADQLYQYKIDVKVRGIGIGYFIKGGYYRGDITVTCKQWEQLNVRDAKGGKAAKLRIQFGEFGGGLVKSLNFGQSFSGVAESDVLWMPGDFVGWMSILKADAEVGMDIAKVRKKLGISGGIGGTLGLMEIVGNADLPPLMFGVYSLSGVVGGVEPEPEAEREGKLGGEITGSVVVGSIWKDGPLPVPKDVIKYGSEAAVLKSMYKGDAKAHFKHDSALLTTGAANLLRKLCSNEMSLLMSPRTTVAITGHTDMSGTDKYNEGLSKNRAENVRRKIHDICGNKIKAKIGEPIYKGAALAKKDPAKKLRDPRYRRVDIEINGVIVLSLIGE